jgi:hypothetical protein
VRRGENREGKGGGEERQSVKRATPERQTPCHIMQFKRGENTPTK